jgi:hypothetical protein
MRTWLIALVVAATLTPAFANDRTPDPDDRRGKQELSMANCPSTVSGARTQVENLPDGAVLTISAGDDLSRQEIRRRARRQEEISLQPERGAIEHTGLGTGSGRYGHCPGMLEHTTVDVIDTADGVRLIIHAQSAEDAARLQRTTRARLRALHNRPRPMPAP